MYKILVLDNTELETNSAYIKAKKYFADKGIEVSFFTKPVSELVSVHEYLKRQGFNWKTGQPAMISYLGLDDIVKDNCRKYVKEGEYDLVIFQYERKQLNVPLLGTEVVTSYSQNKGLYPQTEWVQHVTSQYEVDTDKVWLAISHEIMHAFCKTLLRKGVVVYDAMDIDQSGVAFNQNDNPNSLTGNYAQTLTNIKPHIKLLYRHPYKWFSIAEVEKWKLKPELWLILDKAREAAKVPIVITSGFRTPQQNQAVGGKPKSAHLKGEAVDIACSDNFKRHAILRGLYSLTEPLFIEICKAHIHIDIGILSHELNQTMLELDKD